MNRNVLKSMIAATDGKVFSVEFEKKNKEIRHMVCRLDVKKHLKGGESTTKHVENLVTVFDMQKQGYRSINLDTLSKFTFAGKTYELK